MKRKPIKPRFYNPVTKKYYIVKTHQKPPIAKGKFMKIDRIKSRGVIKTAPKKIAFLTKTPPKLRKTPKLDPLDVLFSEFIRRRAIKRVGGCERCLTQKFDIVKDDGTIFPAWKFLQNSHFCGRIDKSTRWDEDDCAGLCGACHMYLEHHPHEHDAWFRQYLGDEKFELLLARNRQMGKPDKKMLTIYFQQQIKLLDAQNNA